MSAGPMEFCYKENRYFPEEEFYDDPTWGRVHRATRPHTILGDEVSSLSGGDGESGIDIAMDFLPADPGPY